MTQEEKDYYLEHSGVVCPKCHDDQIEGGQITVDAGGASQEVRCLGCGAQWTDLYQLVDVF